MTLSHLNRRSMLGLMAAGGAYAAMGPRLAFANTPVNFQLSWLPSVQFGGSYIAKDQGFWTQSGLDVTLAHGGPNAPVEPPVIAGTALMGISAADYTAAAVANGAKFKIIAVAMQKNPFTIASLPKNPVKTPADLVGKKIGMATADTPVLQALCTLNNVDIKQITIVPTQYDAAPLVSGQVDCLMCWLTDLPVAMTVKGIDNVTMILADYGYAVHSQTYIVLEDALKNRRDDIKKLLKGEIDGWNAYKKDPQAAAALTLKMFPDAGLDLPSQKVQADAQVKLMFSPDTDKFGFGWFTDDSVAQNVKTLGLLDKTVTPDLWDRSVLEELHA